MSTNRPTLGDVAAAHAAAAASRVRVAVDCRVTAYDATEHTVTVQPLVVDREIDPSGEVVDVVPPLLDQVPIAFLRLGGFVISAAPSAGDVGLLVIRDRSHDEIDDGNAPSSGAVSPASRRRWDWEDGIYLPHPVPGELSATQLRSDGEPVIAYTPGEVLRLGSATSTTPVALAVLLRDRLNQHEAAINTVAAAAGAPLMYLDQAPTTLPGLGTTTAELASSRVEVDG